MWIKTILTTLLLLVTHSLFPPITRSADHVTVVVSADASELEQFAAQQLVEQFTRLFETKTVLANEMPDDSAPVVFIGSPSTNSALRNAFPDWPSTSDQTIVLKSKRTSACGCVQGGSSWVEGRRWKVEVKGWKFGG